MTPVQEVGVPLTLMQAGVLVYLYCFHRASVAFHHPWEARMTARHAWLRHTMARRLVPPRNPICRLGHYAAAAGAGLLLLRAVAWSWTGRRVLPRHAWLALFGVGLAAALALNLNAFLYLLPSALLELWLWQCV